MRILSLILILTLSACGGANNPKPVMGDSAEPLDSTSDADSQISGDSSPDGRQDATADADDTVEEDIPPDGSGPIDVVSEPMDPVMAESLQAVVDEWVEFAPDLGVTLAVHTDDGKVWSGSAGLADWAGGTAMEPDFGFRVGSNTKPVVAIATMKLVEDGLVELDQPLTTYLPQYPQWKTVTVRHLLGMASGIPDFLSDYAFMLAQLADPGRILTPEQVVGAVSEQPLAFTPGTQGHYSNTNYVLLGMIIETVTGRPADEYLQKAIIDVTGLQDTYLDMSGEIRDDLSRGYLDLALVADVFGVPKEMLGFIPEENIVQGTIVDCSYLFHPSMAWTSGSLIASSRDMARLFHLLMAGKLLKPESVEEMKKGNPLSLWHGDVNYGLGLQIISDGQEGLIYGHGGVNFGYLASTFWVPSVGATISHMHNFLPADFSGLEIETVELLTNPPQTPRQACLAPADFFGKSPGPTVEGRFKATINVKDVPTPVPGMSFVEMVGEGIPVPLYGSGAIAALVIEENNNQRIEVQSFTRATDNDADIKITTMSMAAFVFSALSESGQYKTNVVNPWAMFVSVSEVYMDSTGTSAEKFCITAVSDFQKSARMAVCRPDEFSPVVGDRLDAFVTYPIITEPDAVAAVLEQLQMPLCSCNYGAEGWKACEN